ncbi:hypothetical protein N7G274_003655 [Stereocaulon virgatum]|uniref:Uncharacterized protein n=1 Tax=Stereocaulon virgatum TaxID=373712 RepID=A0ABR4ABW5_9LECA
MRRSTFNVLIALLFLPNTLATQYSPFVAPDLSHPASYSGIINLFRRDSKCSNSCAMNRAACCPTNTECSLDESGNIGCCPKGAACTGSLGQGGAVTTSAPAAATVRGARAAALTHAITASSTVSNSFYPYPYLPTAYPNAAACTSSFSACQLESAKCTGLLEGGGMAVTISGPGGGVTQAGAMMPASAESICSSLSVEACHGLSLAGCSTLGASVGGNSFVAGTANAAPTNCAGLYGMGIGLGVAVGLAGQVVG